MAALITWQTEVVNPAHHQVHAATEQISSLRPQMNDLMNRRTTAPHEIAQCQTKSEFREWLGTEFLFVKATTGDTVPRSSFDKFPKEDMEARDISVADIIMERAALSGKHQTRDV